MAALAGLGNYQAQGNVEITSDDNSGILLQFTDLELADVADPRVYLTVDGDFSNSLPAGKLPQSEGTFSMMIAAGVDPSDYNTVVIQCRKLKEGIAMAKLS